MIADFKALLPALVVIIAMIAADFVFQPTGWTLIVATALATAVAYRLGRGEPRRPVGKDPTNATSSPRI